jgi:4-hydroxybenzoate polyprenyltransferase
LWPTLWALWIAAHGVPKFSILSIFILGVIIMRSAGCVINDIADRDFDPHVLRTRERPLATQKMTLREALLLFIILGLLAFACVIFLNLKTMLLSIIALLLAILYPFMKRYTHWPQFFLGLAFAWSIPMAFTAVTNSIPLYGWLLFLITVLWTLAYDTQYAMVDRIDDVKIGIKSTAILFGAHDRLIIGLLQLLIISGLALLGWMLHFHWVYFFFLGISLLVLCYQQYLLRTRLPARCLRAFISNQWFGCFVFMGIVGSFW